MKPVRFNKRIDRSVIIIIQENGYVISNRVHQVHRKTIIHLVINLRNIRRKLLLNRSTEYPRKGNQAIWLRSHRGILQGNGQYQLVEKLRVLEHLVELLNLFIFW